MKALITLTLIFFSFFVKGDSWVRKADFGGVKREAAVGFSIGNKGYIGTGVLNFESIFIRTNDFWEYDPATNVWTQKANFGGKARYGATGFSIGNMGYIGTGQDSGGVTKDFWAYDVVSNSWTQKADFLGTPRMTSVGISISDKGYVGTGIDSTKNLLKDFWEYDTLTDAWARKADYGGTPRFGAVGFIIDGKGYIGTGIDSTKNPLKDFWEYDTLTDTWARKADYGGFPRSGSVGFSVNKKGYLGTGNGWSREFWEYDPLSNMWTQKADSLLLYRSIAVAFSINSKGYLGTGNVSWSAKDFWEYTPDSTTAINELSSSGFQFQVWPNPAHNVLRLTPNPLSEREGANSRCEVLIMDVEGRKVYSCSGDCFVVPPRNYVIASGAKQSPNSSFTIDISGLAQGLYFIVAADGRERVVRKFLKE